MHYFYDESGEPFPSQPSLFRASHRRLWLPTHPTALLVDNFSLGSVASVLPVLPDVIRTASLRSGCHPYSADEETEAHLKPQAKLVVEQSPAQGRLTTGRRLLICRPFPT